jgi:c-di-GMP-related signal transduction protein
VGRQAIYDREGDVVAYELLFRDAAEAVSAADRGSYATSQVIVAAFADFGIDELVDNKACFVNVTREFLVGELPVPFDPARVGVELLADVAVDNDVVAGVQALAEQGYTIAVDQSGTERGQESLLPYASYAKIDMLVDDRDQTLRAIDRCRRYPHVQLIAERLETIDDVQAAMSLGFQLFQGHGLGRPHVERTTTVNPVRMHRIRLLVELNSGEVSLERAAAIIQHDPGLAMRVLRLVNSAASGLRRTIASITDAVTMVGTRKLQQWLTLMLMADLADGDEAALENTVIRARMCHTLAERRGVCGDTAFTAGLLTGIADLVGQPTDRLTANLPLTADLSDALTGNAGPLTDIVHTVRDYQQGPTTASITADLGTDMLDAIRWTNTTIGPMAQAAA